VRLKDIHIDELIHKMGWIQRSKDGNRQKIENRIRTQWINKYCNIGEKVSINPSKENLTQLKELLDRGKPESDEAERELMNQHQVDYEKIYEHLKKFTNTFLNSETKVVKGKEMKESVALAKEANTKKDVSSTRSDKSIHRLRNEPERQLGSLRSVIGNIRHDGGTPSLDSIATELSSMHTAQRASVLLALQRTHGNRYVQRVVAGIQAKLKVGQPGDVYEQEADRVAEQVMRMSEPEVNPEEEGEELIQTKPVAGQITPLVQRQLEFEEEGERKEEEEELKIKNCSKKNKGRILTGKEGAEELAKKAYEVLEPQILRYYVSTALDRNFGEEAHKQKSDIIKRFKNIESNLDAKRFECVKNGKCNGYCAYADTPGTRIYLCPTFGQGGCKDFGSIILHESAHNDGANLDVNTGGKYPPANAIDNAFSYEYFAEEVKKGPSEAPTRYRVPKETAPLEKLQRQAEEEIPIMKKNLYGETPQISHDLQGRLYCSRGGGNHLPLETRAFMEERFGVNFSPVRIHADSQAAQMARALNAEAFTYGKDIYFEAERYKPETSAGKKLLAHELAHVVQQNHKSRYTST
jgi:predicted metal-dependent hydrolase